MRKYTDDLNYNSKNAHKQRPPRNHTGVGPPNRQRTKQKCGRHGKSQKHNKQQCPAINSTCRKYHKRDHFSSCCFSKDVSFLREDENLESEEDAFLGCPESLGGTQWHATVNLNQKDMMFKIRHKYTKVKAISEVPFTFSFLHNTISCRNLPKHSMGQHTLY